MHRTDGFSVIELLIVVVIIADLTTIAMPAVYRARISAQNTQFISELRTTASAIELFAAENTRYPAESASGTMPLGLAIYLRNTDWAKANALGGQWDWDYQSNGVNAAITVVLPQEDDTRMSEIDERIDNGALVTGAFRKTGTRRYSYIIE